jgi:hypothetical protein
MAIVLLLGLLTYVYGCSVTLPDGNVMDLSNMAIDENDIRDYAFYGEKYNYYANI